MTAANWRWRLAAAAVSFCLLGGAAEAATGNLEVIEPGKLIVGYSPSAGTFDVVDGKVTGIFGLIMQEAAHRLGLEIEPQAFDFPGLIPALQAGRVDVAGNFSITQPRAQIMYFTTPQFFQPEVMAVRPGFKLSSWEEAAQRGLTLASNTGYFQIGAWEQMGIKVHTFDTVDACLLDVINQGSDGCAVGAFPVIYLQATQPDSPAAKLDIDSMSGPQITTDVNAFGVNKNNPDLARALSQATVDMWRDGTIEKIYASVFKSAPFENFLSAPTGEALYVPGPWEDGVAPPAATDYPKVTTVADGTLTVGVAANSPLLSLDGTTLKGPEADIIAASADKLGLKVAAVAVDDPAAALNGGKVDLVAGAFAESEARAHQFWFTTPIAFNPDYIYVKPADDGSLPAYTKWEDVTTAKGKLAAIAGSPRLDQLKSAGADVATVADAAAGLKAVVDGSALGFVGSTVDYSAAVSADPALAKAGIGWVRNVDSYTAGEAYAWGVKAGNGTLLDALNQSIAASWQDRVIARAIGHAFPGADPTALAAPGPTVIGTSYGSSKDYRFMSMWLAGPWLQRPGSVK